MCDVRHCVGVVRGDKSQEIAANLLGIIRAYWTRSALILERSITRVYGPLILVGGRPTLNEEKYLILYTCFLTVYFTFSMENNTSMNISLLKISAIM